jgi:hypothetical protein
VYGGVGGVRRAESGVVGWAGSGACAGRVGRFGNARRAASDGAHGQRGERRVEGHIAGRRHGGWGGLDRWHAAVAARRDGSVVRSDLFPLDIGLVSAFVPLRPRPAAGRCRRQVLGRAGGSVAAVGRRWHGVGRCRRHHHRGPRLRQAGRRVRLLEGPRVERAAGHRRFGRVRPGGGGAAAPPGGRTRRAARNGWSPTPPRLWLG